MSSTTIRTIACAALAWLTLGASRPALGQQAVTDLLKGLASQNRLSVPLSASIKAEIHGIEGDRQDRLTLTVRPGRGATSEETAVEFESAKLRALALGPAELHTASGGKTKQAAPDAALDGTSWSVEDLLPFSPDRCAAMRIADLQPDAITLICEPKRPLSQYSLMVWKFDRQKLVPLQVLLYKDTLNNLVKMTRFDDYAEIGKVWRPKRIVMQDFKLRTKDTFELDWRENPEAPAALFEVKSFAAAAAAGS